MNAVSLPVGILCFDYFFLDASLGQLASLNVWDGVLNFLFSNFSFSKAALYKIMLLGCCLLLSCLIMG